MDFKEIISGDVDGVYAEYVSVEDAKKSGLIPPSFVDSIPNRCDCGSEFIIKNSLKNIKCCDPKCKFKIAYSMAEMFTRFGIQGLKEGTCLKIVEWGFANNFFKIPAHTEILNLRDDDSSRSLAGVIGVKYSELLLAVDIIRGSSMSYGEMVSKLAIPNFDGKIVQILSDVNSTQDLLFLNKENPREGVKEYLIKHGVYSLPLIHSFIESLDVIYECEKNLTGSLRMNGIVTINIAISGSLSVQGRKLSRDNFITLANEAGKVCGVQIFSVTVGKAFQSASYFVIDEMSASKTCQAASFRQSQSSEKIIFTGDEFIQLIVKEARKWEQKIKEMNLN